MSDRCRLLVPDGSLEQVIHQLLADAGISITYSDPRSYRGLISNKRLFPAPDNWATKIRPWDSPWIIADQRAELAFTGDDLLAEYGRIPQPIVIRRYPLSRSGVGKTRLVIAIPNDSPIQSADELTANHELVTEYNVVAWNWVKRRKIVTKIRSCHGSLEAFIEIADAILENVETGHSLEIGGWRIIEEVMESQTCLITYPEALKGGRSKEVIEEFCLLLDAVMTARQKRILKCNVTPDRLEAVLAIIPAADKPTVNELTNGAGFALESVVPAERVEELIIQLKQVGATAIFTYQSDKYVP